MTIQRTYTVTEIYERTGIPKDRIRQAIKERKLEAHVFSDRTFRCTESAIERWFESMRHQVDDAPTKVAQIAAKVAPPPKPKRSRSAVADLLPAGYEPRFH